MPSLTLGLFSYVLVTTHTMNPAYCCSLCPFVGSSECPSAGGGRPNLMPFPARLVLKLFVLFRELLVVVISLELFILVSVSGSPFSSTISLDSNVHRCISSTSSCLPWCLSTSARCFMLISVFGMLFAKCQFHQLQRPLFSSLALSRIRH